jgi:hypothetical protein
MSAEDAHRDACWVLTIVGGLALTKALEEALPSINFSQWSSTNLIVFLRLFIFGAVSIRLFIGASVFFQMVHIEAGHDDPKTGYPQCNYVVDFASSIVHFSLLYFMAASILEIPKEPYLPQQRFFLALCAVLLYDWIWFGVSAAYSTAPKIKKWAVPNTFAAGICIAFYAAFRYGLIDRDWFEIILMLITVFFSIPDGMRMAKGRLPD